MWTIIDGSGPASLVAIPREKSPVSMNDGQDSSVYTYFRWDWPRLRWVCNIHDFVEVAIGRLLDFEWQDAAHDVVFAKTPAEGRARQWQVDLVGMVQVDYCLAGKTKDPRSYLHIHIKSNISHCIVCGRQGYQQAVQSPTSAKNYYIFIRKAWGSS